MRTSRSIVPISGVENSICKLISNEANFRLNPTLLFYCWTRWSDAQKSSVAHSTALLLYNNSAFTLHMIFFEAKITIGGCKM